MLNHVQTHKNAKTQNIHIEWLLSVFRPSSQRIIEKKKLFLVILPGGITGDLQVSDANLHYSLKTSHREKQALLIIERLRENSDKIPSANREETVFAETTFAEVDVNNALKRIGLTIKFDGSEDHLVSNNLKALVWDEMKEFR